MKSLSTSPGILRACMALLAVSPASAEQSPPADLRSAVADARSAAGAGDYVAAFAKGVATLEAHPESQWEQATLRRFILEVGDRWFPRLSPEQKQAAMALLTDPKSPGAKMTKAYALWKLKQRVQALALLMPLIQQYPDSIGAEYAIRSLLLAQKFTLGDLGTTSTTQTIAQTAPNNPATAWALCNVAWYFGPQGRFDQLQDFYGEIETQVPKGSLAARAAADLRSVLQAIEREDHAAATDTLAGLREYLWTGTDPSMIADTFLKGIDWKNPQASNDRIAALQKYFTQVADTHANGEHRTFAMVVLARILSKQGKNIEAADQLQRIVDTGVKLFKSYALSRIGYLVEGRDTDRAIAALEQHRIEEGPASVAMREDATALLGRLYLRKKDYAKAEEVFAWLLEQHKAGEFLFDNLGEEVAGHLAKAMFAQGKDEQAEAVIGPYLARYRYGTPKESLTEKELIQLLHLLETMGRKDESQLYLEEVLARRKR